MYRVVSNYDPWINPEINVTQSRDWRNRPGLHSLTVIGRDLANWVMCCEVTQFAAIYATTIYIIP